MPSNSAGGITNLSWLRFFPDREDKSVASRGGICIVLTAEAAVVSGNVVFASASPSNVNKSATSSNYASFVGVVVGGALTNMRPVYDLDIACAGAGQLVLVQISGIAYCKAEGTITIGTHRSVIVSSSTAGYVIAGTTQGQMLGTPLISATTGNGIYILINHR